MTIQRWLTCYRKVLVDLKPARLKGGWASSNVDISFGGKSKYHLAMRLRQRRWPLALLFISFLHLAYTLKPTGLPISHDYGHGAADLAEGKAPSRDDPAGTDPTAKYPASLQAKDAPIDGKDGRPHTGPFVETSAERGRKKAKGSAGDGEKSATSDKPPVKGKVPEDAPETNDGVMDDPYRTGPKEGTTGTEGGVSEKSRDKEGSLAAIGAEEGKKPDPPKEAPPLPHSEQEKVGGKESGKKSGDGAPEDGDKAKDKWKDKQKELGGLKVYPLFKDSHDLRLTLRLRNPKTYHLNRTPYHTQLPQAPLNRIPSPSLLPTPLRFHSSPPPRSPSSSPFIPSCYP